jgi:hypothetical protein
MKMSQDGPEAFKFRFVRDGTMLLLAGFNQSVQDFKFIDPSKSLADVFLIANWFQINSLRSEHPIARIAETGKYVPLIV